LVLTALNNASADICAVFVRNALVAANATLTLSPVVGSGTNTAGEIITIAVTGMTLVGAAAIRQFGKQANQTSGVPTPVLPTTASTQNLTLTAAGSSTTAGCVPNASWTEREDANQINPTTCMEVATRDSGFTGTSAAYVSIASAVWNSSIVELNNLNPNTVVSLDFDPDRPASDLLVNDQPNVAFADDTDTFNPTLLPAPPPFVDQIYDIGGDE
jgi:hypothetical protein